MKMRAFMYRVYRQDARARENWSSILTRVEEARPADPAYVSNQAHLQNEYVAAVLNPNTYYSVDRRVTEQAEDGTEVEAPRSDFFYVNSVSTSRHKEQVMHTVQTADELIATSPLVIEVEKLDRWQHADRAEPDGDAVRVYAEADPLWVLPTDIAKFSDMEHNLWRYTTPSLTKKILDVLS